MAKITRKPNENDCLSVAVARILHKQPKKVPFFISSDDWFRRLRLYCKRNGYLIRVLPATKINMRKAEKSRRMFILIGVSLRSKYIVKPDKKIPKNVLFHASVCYGDRIIVGGDLKYYRKIYIFKKI